MESEEELESESEEELESESEEELESESEEELELSLLSISVSEFLVVPNTFETSISPVALNGIRKLE